MANMFAQLLALRQQVEELSDRLVAEGVRVVHPTSIKTCIVYSTIVITSPTDG